MGKEEFALRLRALRLQRGLSKAQLAMRAAVHPSYAGKMENAVLKTPPSRQVVARLAWALGVPPEELTDLAGRPDVEALRLRIAWLEKRVAELEEPLVLPTKRQPAASRLTPASFSSVYVTTRL